MFKIPGKGFEKALYSVLMKINFNVFFILVLHSLNSFAQFAPSVGINGTTALYKDSSAFVDWAYSGSIIGGYQDISNNSLGYANVGDSSCAFGIAGTSGVVSLGDGGMATLQFNYPIIDGSGFDFAVFENSFNDTFLELAFVEVSSDGIHFFRFPAISNTDSTIQTNTFGSTDATNINNLAGKYRGEYGTPFDLADIPNNALLNKQAITHVRIIDVVGCIQKQYCTRDANHHIVNDPWPTPFGSGGFDLDAVGVIHNQTILSIDKLELNTVTIFPNPAQEELHVTLPVNKQYNIIITDLSGRTVITQLSIEKTINTIVVKDLEKGIYFLTILYHQSKKTIKFIKL